MRKLIGILLTICTPLALAGEVYRWVDAHGNHVFSDELPAEDSDVTQVREVLIERIRTVPAFKPPPAPHRQRTTNLQSHQARYSDFVIKQPENGAAKRDDAGKILVETHVEPALRPGHFVILKMDGQPVASGKQTVFHLESIDRGTHTLTAELKNNAGQLLISTPPVSFTMLRNSLLSPTRQPEEPIEPEVAEIVELFPLID